MPDVARSPRRPAPSEPSTDAATIAIDSQSYPYLAVAQQLGMDYGAVLNFADRLDAIPYFDIDTFKPWQLRVYSAWTAEWKRRRQQTSNDRAAAASKRL